MRSIVADFERATVIFTNNVILGLKLRIFSTLPVALAGRIFSKLKLIINDLRDDNFFTYFVSLTNCFLKFFMGREIVTRFEI